MQMDPEKEEELIKLYYQVAYQAGKRAQDKTEIVHMFSGQYRCLRQLETVERISQKDLAALLEIRTTSLGETLTKLEKKGYVKRETSDEDRRVSYISITPSGKEQVERARKDGLRERHELIAPLTEEEKEQFYHILKKIKDSYLEVEGN